MPAAVPDGCFELKKIVWCATRAWRHTIIPSKNIKCQFYCQL